MSRALEITRQVAEQMGDLDRRMQAVDATPGDPRFDERWEETWGPLLARHCHPDIELRSHLIGAEGGRSYRGLAGLREYAGDVFEQFSRFERDADSFDEVRAGVVVFHQRVKLTGRLSQAPLETDIWVVWRVEDELVRFSDTYLSRDEAYEAAAGDP